MKNPKPILSLCAIAASSVAVAALAVGLRERSLLAPEPPSRSASPSVVAAASVSRAGIKTGVRLPPSVMRLVLRDLDGNRFRLADLAGQTVVVHIWESSCSTCRMQIRDLSKLAREFRARRVVFVGLSFEDPAVSMRQVRQAAHDEKIPYRIGFVPPWAAQKFAIIRSGVLAFPQTWVLNRDGMVRAKGVVMPTADLKAALQKAIA